jgi:hypothetical protein
MPGPPLSTPLSHLLVAFTIEFDNEFDHRLTAAGAGRRLPISMVMWSNFMRFVGDGITVGELPAATGIPKSRTLSTLGGMERWRYVFISAKPTGAAPRSKRDGWGSARALRGEWFVHPTPAGRRTQAIAPPLFGEIETRWERRFGADAIDELRRALAAVIARLDVELPEYLPIIGSFNGMRAEIEHRERGAMAGAHLPARLAQVLLAYTLEFERKSELSLPLTANFVRVLGKAGLNVREIPAIAGVSPEATSMALKFLTKTGYGTVEAKLARLTAKGLEAQAAAPGLHSDAEQARKTQRLRRACHGILANPRLSEGLRPYPDGWRARKRYAKQTNAVIDDPTGRLPHYPMVLHRGGWPDGS